jgi:L-methionine (R)-S-oxide reductase
LSHVTARYEFKDKTSDYASLARELTSLLADETDLIANAANTTALIFDAVPRLNWVGFIS